jgi:transglutaminase-like putative cysteine protease
VSATVHSAVLDSRGGRSGRSRSIADAPPERIAIRLATFGALGVYGVVRWSTLLSPAPQWRLLGMLALALAMAAAGPALRERPRAVSIVAVAVVILVAFAMAGIPVRWIVHVRITRTADGIGQGLSALPGVFVPYVGIDGWVRIVILLGAGVLLLDGALVLTFAPRELGELRRAGAALPLVALAVVPATLVHPRLAYVQGLLLFGLLAAFMWGERVRRGSLADAIAIATLAGAAAIALAPVLDQHRPWINYRAWTGTPTVVRVDRFDWNQTYGPLNWPRAGHEVLDVRARTPDYWKAENLDQFNGVDWVDAADALGGPLPMPDRSALARWTQPLQITVRGLQTTDVIAAGEASQPSSVPGTVPGLSAGTWLASQELGPGASYSVSVYSPRPTASQLAAAGSDYPAAALDDDVSLDLPRNGLSVGAAPEVRFPPFHSGLPVQSVIGPYGASATGEVASSPYGPAFALAQRLADRAQTPFGFVQSVEAYLGHGFTYNEDPPQSTYPLESFLFQSKTGYCQQFSGAMALLLRMGGIPARVSAGFTTGRYDRSAHEYVVSDLDAHAWVEVWFPRYGWVRFDPTPAAAPARRGVVAPPILPSRAGARAALPHGARRDAAAGSTTRVAPRRASRHGIPALIVLALVLVLGVGLPVLIVRRTRRRPEPTGEELVSELERALARCGRPVPGGATLASLERRFHSSPAAAAYVRAIRLARFGDGEHLPTPAQRRALRAHLGDGLGVTGRLRAMWALPPLLPRLGRLPNAPGRFVHSR